MPPRFESRSKITVVEYCENGQNVNGAKVKASIGTRVFISKEVEEERMLIHCRPIFVKVMQLDYHLPRQNKIQLRLMQPVLLRDGNSSFALMAKKGKD